MEKCKYDLTTNKEFERFKIYVCNITVFSSKGSLDDKRY